jgi:hypothetical protein
VKKVLMIVAAVVGGLVVLGVIVIGGVFYFTSGAVDAGERFLALLAQDRIEEAYASTATSFRGQQTEASFAAAVRAIGLTRYESASWSNREIQNDRARLEGSVTTTDGGTIPLTVTLVSEGDEWKVLGLSTPMAGAEVQNAATPPAAPATPPERSEAPPSGAAGGETKSEPPTDAPPAADASRAAVVDGGAAYTITDNASLTGRLGRVVVTYPEGTSPSSTRIEVRPEGGTETSTSGFGNHTADLLPGKYDVTISNVTIPGVEVRSRSDSTIAVGVLRVSAGSSTRIQVFKGDQAVASGFGKVQFGLPAGAYEVEVSGKREPITIPAGGAVDF